MNVFRSKNGNSKYYRFNQRALLLIPLALACFALLPTAQAGRPHPSPTPAPTATPTPTPTPVATQTFAAGFESSIYRGGGPVIKSSPGSVLTVYGTSDRADVFMLLFDKATAPVPGDIPALAVHPDNSYERGKMVFNYTGQGVPFSNGISWAVSTSPAVLQGTTEWGSTQMTVTFKDPSTPTQRFSSTVYGLQPAGEVAKASPGTVFTASVTTHATGNAFVLFFDKATTPVNGDVPVLAMDTWFAAGSGASFGGTRFANYADTPLHFANGISWAISRSPTVLTPLSVGAEVQVTLTYQ